jgi:carbon storage regulator
MLVLSRKANETIAIGEVIRITVLSIKRSQVNIGIVAPRHMAICRVDVPVAQTPLDQPVGMRHLKRRPE